MITGDDDDNRNDFPAHFDPAASAVVIETLTIPDRDVVREAQHWTTGRRGPLVEDRDDLMRADLSAFAAEAIILGSRVLAATAQTTEARAIEQMLKEVETRTAGAALSASELTRQAVRDASEVVAKVAGEAKTAITEADQRNRTELAAAVDSAKRDLATEIRRLVGGDNPELLERLQVLLEKVGSGLENRMRAGAGELLDKAARQFDPSDPTSPMAKHTAALDARQKTLAEELEKQYTALSAKVDELTTSVKVQEGRASLAKVTPIKGGSLEARIHELMHGIAAGLGDEYVDTTSAVGAVPSSKKGDGVLHVDGGPTRVVVEMTDSARSAWGDYLDGAERNRSAVAGLGIVRTPEQNAGRTIRVLGARRLVMAYDPDEGDPELLRTVVMLLRTMAVAVTARSGAAEIATAEERIAEAVTQLDKIDAVKKLANAIQKNAAKIDSECTGISTAIHRLLDQALAALAGTGPAATPPVTGDGRSEVA